MNTFLACSLAVVCARIFIFAVQRTGWQIIAWRARRMIADASPKPLITCTSETMRAIRAVADAQIALETAADAYALAPGQGTLDQLTETAAAFGKTQTPQLREMRLRIAEMRARMPAP